MLYATVDAEPAATKAQHSVICLDFNGWLTDTRRTMRATPSPILIAALCIFLGSIIDAVVKGVAAEAALSSLLAWRFATGGVISFGLCVATKQPRPTFRAVRFHTLRSAIQLTSAFLFFWALTQLALAEATVIGFTSALMVAPLAALILRERVTATSLVAAIFGFAGAVLAVSTETSGAPEGGQRVLGAAAAFAAAFLYSLTLIFIRLRAREEPPLLIAAFTNIIPGLMLFPVLVIGLPNQDWSVVPIFVGLGVLGFTVWWLFSVAYSRAPAQRLAPLEYTALIWSAILGVIFFGEVPGWPLYIGAVIIIAACLIVAFEDKFSTRREARAPASGLPD
ncbi:MAG: DMT family transporter [Pseudomonadota bacterium]